MKEKILAFLVANLAGIQKAYLEGIADVYSKTITDETQIQTVLNQDTLNVIKFSANQLQIEGDKRATEASKTAIKTYEEKYSLKDGKQVQQQQQQQQQNNGGGTQNPQINNDTPEWAKALIESNKALTEKVSALELQKTKQEKQLQAQNAIQSSKLLPDNLKTKWANRINPESEVSIEDQLKELETEYTELHTNIVGSVSGKGLPKGGGASNGQPNKEAVDEIVNKL